MRPPASVEPLPAETPEDGPTLEFVIAEEPEAAPSLPMVSSVVADATASLPRPALSVDDGAPAQEVEPTLAVPLPAPRPQPSEASDKVERHHRLPGVGSPVVARLRQRLSALSQRPLLILLWFATAVIPAASVWLMMRHSHQPCQKVEHVQAAMPAVVLPAALPARATEERCVADVAPAAKPPQGSVGPAVSGSAAPASSGVPSPDAEFAASVTSAASVPLSELAPPSAPSAPPVVVLTDAGERVPVVIRSSPTGARVYRLGKEIARTPVIVEVARGERRVFEVGFPSMGTRRIGVDGSKSEIMVLVGGEPAAAAAATAAPLPPQLP